MGVSLSRDLLQKKLAQTIVGFDLDESRSIWAKKKKYISAVSKDLMSDLKKADLVILAIPVLELKKILKDVASVVSEKALVIDLGSTKKTIVQKADQLFKKGNFVGCHPMAGRERSGPESSVTQMFEGAPCLIVPGKRTHKKFVSIATDLWSSVGSRVVVMNALQHDRYVAACSHLPHVLSFALMQSVAQKISPAELKKVSGPGFKSYTRVAGSDAKMWTDIFLDNQKLVLNKLKAFKKELVFLEKQISKKDESKIKKYIQKSSSLWRDL